MSAKKRGVFDDAIGWAKQGIELNEFSKKGCVQADRQEYDQRSSELRAAIRVLKACEGAAILCTAMGPVFASMTENGQRRNNALAKSIVAARKVAAKNAAMRKP